MVLDRFLVCGLGSLGQHCVLSLKEFGVRVIAIEQIQPQSWEIPNQLNLLERLIIGDCRQNHILEQAKISECRAALIVTSNEQVNIETALAIRQIDPQIRLVVRSAKANLNELLSKQLGNFIAYEPTELPAQAFALAALGTETLGFFNLDGEWLKVIQCEIKNNHPWTYNRLLYELNSRTRRILAHANSADSLPQNFHIWESETNINPGDTLIYIETATQFSLQGFPTTNISSAHTKTFRGFADIPLLYQHLQQQFIHFWQLNLQQQIRRVAIIYGLLLLVLLLTNTLLYEHYYPGIPYSSAFFASVLLLLGGYGDVFGGNLLQVDAQNPLPIWLRFFSLALSLVGTALVGILYGFLTEKLLSRKFQLVKRRPPIPQQDHIVIVGLGRVGQRVATLLHQFKQSLVGVTFNPDFNSTLLSELPLIVGNLSESLVLANISEAKSVVVVTDDEILNLEVALMVQAKNPDSYLVIRTSGQRLSQHLMAAFPNAQVLGMYAVAAQVFAGAAFGENIINLFRFNGQTILVTEYQIEAGDTLNELLLSEVALGYGVVPILHQRKPNSSKLIPSDDILLAVGDRLVVLATIEGLQRIEVGNKHPKLWLVKVESSMSTQANFEGANTISRISGCPLNVARELMNNLPGVLNFPLYKHQGQRLIRSLGKLQVIAALIPISAIN
ncbi:potassium transporter TrkA [Oscillatoriales cyanobacterium USR001]|nr:potassium transporter TrkA [Oscillatoriales cyanobacterium USR001]